MDFYALKKLHVITILLCVVTSLGSVYFLMRGGFEGWSVFDLTNGRPNKEGIMTVLGLVLLGFAIIWGVVSYIVKCLMKQSLKS